MCSCLAFACGCGSSQTPAVTPVQPAPAVDSAAAPVSEPEPAPAVASSEDRCPKWVLGHDAGLNVWVRETAITSVEDRGHLATVMGRGSPVYLNKGEWEKIK